MTQSTAQPKMGVQVRDPKTNNLTDVGERIGAIGNLAMPVVEQTARNIESSQTELLLAILEQLMEMNAKLDQLLS